MFFPHLHSSHQRHGKRIYCNLFYFAPSIHSYERLAKLYYVILRNARSLICCYCMLYEQLHILLTSHYHPTQLIFLFRSVRSPVAGIILSSAMVIASSGAGTGLSVKYDLAVGMMGAGRDGINHPWVFVQLLLDLINIHVLWCLLSKNMCVFKRQKFTE